MDVKIRGLIHPAVVDAQEFVGARSHINKAGLAPSMFLVHKLVGRPSCGIDFSKLSITRERVLRSSGDPLLDVRTLLALWLSDQSAPGSTPVKEIIELCE